MILLSIIHAVADGLEISVSPENDLNLVTRLRYKTDLRNTDERRLTSLAWAALSVAEDVYEWLLLDAGHDDDELSRVSRRLAPVFITLLLISLPCSFVL